MHASLLILIAAMITLFVPKTAHAFCVYNDAPFSIDVIQWAGGKDFKSFSRTIRPGRKACCHWSNRDCNRSGRRTETVAFKIQARLGHEKLVLDGDHAFRTSSLYCGGQDSKRDNFRLVWTQAGGSIAVRWTGPVNDRGRFDGTYIEKDWLKAHAWNVDSSWRGAQVCHKNEKGWSPSDLL